MLKSPVFQTFLALDVTSRCRIGATPKRGIGGSNSLTDGLRVRGNVS